MKSICVQWHDLILKNSKCSKNHQFAVLNNYGATYLQNVKVFYKNMVDSFDL